MSDKKIIAVLDSTGAQGGDLVRAILDAPGGPLTARAVTRDAGSAKARALAGLGVEVVEASLEDENLLRAAFAGVAHVVWSTLEDTREVIPASDQRVPVLQDRYTVPHFDAKAEAEDIGRRVRRKRRVRGQDGEHRG